MNHLNHIAAHLKDYDIDPMLITSAPGEFYAVGFHGEGAVLVTEKENYYFTDSRYIEAAEKQIGDCHVSLPPAGMNYPKTIQSLVEKLNIKTIGFEGQYMSVDTFRRWEEALSAKMTPAGKLLDELRMVKDEEEIRLMEAAQRITDEAFTKICAFIKPGISEIEIAARLQYEMLLAGAQRMSFDPIVASGPNGSMPHAIPGERKVQKGDFITMDFGCVVGGYCSDMTRTVALGEPTEEMKKVYATVLEAQLAGIAVAKAGVTGDTVHAAAADIIAKAGYGKYFGHGFGHSVGIEIHENPRFSPAWKKAIPAGAALSAEPGIYIPGKFGVRIEDVLILEEGGNRDITHSSKELIIL